MSNILFGYDNQIDTSGVTITHSTEASGAEAENTQSIQLSETFRTSVLNPGYVKYAFAPARHVGLIAAFGSTATPWKNLALGTDDLSTGWTATGVSVQQTGNVATSTRDVALAYWLQDDTSTGNHKIARTGHTIPSGGGTTVQLCLWVTVSTSGADLTQFRIECIPTSGATASADFDASGSGSVLASSGATATAIETFTGVDGATYYRAGLTFTAASAANPLEIGLYNLKAGSASYTGASEGGVRFGAVALEGIADPSAVQFGEFYPVSTVQGSLWRLQVDPYVIATELPYRNLPLNGNMADRTGIGTYWKAAPGMLDSVQLDFWDPDNSSSQIDTGHVYVGPYYQPAVQTVTLLDMDFENGRRINTYGMNFIKKSEATGAFAEMAQKLDIRSGQRWESMDGQISIARQGSVVVVANPEETINPDETLLHGYVTAMSRVYRQSGRAYSVTHGEPMFSFSVTVEEIIL